MLPRLEVGPRLKRNDTEKSTHHRRGLLELDRGLSRRASPVFCVCLDRGDFVMRELSERGEEEVEVEK